MSDITDDPAGLLRTLPLNSLVVEPWMNGLYATLALQTAWALIFTAKRTARNMVWLAIVVIMFAVATIHSGLTWGFLISAFQFHGTTPRLIDALADNPPWYRALGDVTWSINVLIADCLFIWRCWVVWEYRWSVVILPILATIAGQVVAVIAIVGQVAGAEDPDPSGVSQHFATFTTPYANLSIATSLFTTTMIVIKILMVQRRSKAVGIGPHSHFGAYGKVLEVLIESAVIYSACMLAYVILTVQESLLLDYPQQMQPQVAGIAVTLIIFRVALGHARPDEAWSTKASNANITFGSASYAMSNTLNTKSSTTAANRSMQQSKGSSTTYLQSMPSFTTSVITDAEDVNDTAKRYSPV